MKLSEIIGKYDFYPSLQKKFPSMANLAEEVEVIPWRDEFNVADKNPEVIEALEFLDMLLKNGMITEEQYIEQSRKVATSYASKTMGMAFIKDRKISFREAVPKPAIVLHELGHVYFQVHDILWNASYGGGEILLHLALNNRYYITEGHIRRYHALLEKTYEDPEGVHKLITDAIAPRLDVYPHLFTICLFAGYIPDFEARTAFEFWDDLKSEKWGTIPVEQHHLFAFMQNLVEGLKYDDPAWVNFAEWLGIIEECPICGRLVCKCD